jgi:hypothetical protein
MRRIEIELLDCAAYVGMSATVFSQSKESKYASD